MNISLTKNDLSLIRKPLTKANLKFNKEFPGETSERQPIHTVYGGAQIFTQITAKKMGESALKHFHSVAKNGNDLARLVGKPETNNWNKVYDRVLLKLQKEAVEDFRIDFEDGYGNRPDSEEDKDAEKSALEVVQGMKNNSLPSFIGIRIKPFNEERVSRSIRTMDIFLTTLIKSGKKLPANFVITLPKIQVIEQIKAFEKTLTSLEKKLKLKAKSLKCELMVETTQSIFGPQGEMVLKSFIDACIGRCRGLHFGTYDYTAGCNITASLQKMQNLVCDYAKHSMQVSVSGTKVTLSDGATNIMPVTIHRGENLNSTQIKENNEAIQKAWRLSFSDIRHSLECGFYQGWDLHPNQLPIRYVATYSFFRESFDDATNRLKGFIEKAAKATLLGDVFDDAATGQGLLNYFLRGLSSGAISEEEAFNTGLTREDFDSRSFLKILEKRK